MKKPCYKCSQSGVYIDYTGYGLASIALPFVNTQPYTIVSCKFCQGTGWVDDEELILVKRKYIKDEYSMKIFEIHITGEESIIAELDALNIKNITIELLRPNHQLLRTEYMSSFIHHADDYDQCLCFVNTLLLNLKSKIIRVKIECPPYPEYLGQALYAESHFEPIDRVYPISRNTRSQKLMATAREYDSKKYSQFLTNWKGVADVEICLFDSFVEEDEDWFALYGMNVNEAVCALIFRGDKILAVSRKDNPNDFGLIGGKVDKGETKREALVREVKEETGLIVTEAIKVFDMIDADGFICHTYLCEAYGDIVTTEKGVVNEVSWADLFEGSFTAYNRELHNSLAKSLWF